MGGPMRNPFTRLEGPRSHTTAVRPTHQSPSSKYSVATTHTIDRIANGAPPVPSMPVKVPVPARKPLPPASQQTDSSSDDEEGLSACAEALLKVNSISPEPAAWALQSTASQQIVDPWTRHSLEDTDPDSPSPASKEEEGDQHFFRAQAAAKLEGAWDGPLDSPPPFLSAGSLQGQQDRRIAGPSNLQVRGVEPSTADASSPAKASQPGLFRSFSKSAKQGLGKLAGLRRQESSSGARAVGEVSKRDSGMYYPNALPRKRKPSASPARTLDLSSGTSSSPSSSAGKGGRPSPAPRAAEPTPRTRKVVGHQDRVTQFGDFIDYASSSSGSQHEKSQDKPSSPVVVDLSTYQAPPPPPPPIGSASRCRAEKELPALPKETGLGISGAGRSAAGAESTSPSSDSSSEEDQEHASGEEPRGVYTHGGQDQIIRQIDAMPSLSLQQKAWAATEAQRLREKLRQHPNQSRAPPSFPLTPPTSPPSSTSAGVEGLTNLLAPYTSPSSSEGNPETIIDTVFHPGHTSWRITGFSDPDTIEFFHGRVPVAAAQRQLQKGKGMGEGLGVGARDEAAVLMERLERERWGAAVFLER
ncbi:hypothetical protein KC343_g9264 [Hortaea werneckii]|nr:hypothetical protein KC352_g14485 [Hortaea werneckii]KAI7564782.1 hypothetical protein KC317_g6818 [Hortaea werneckii]KAI7610350.1 hypothetical protein KC346_g8769 [Hortaea werneckii]KAI7617996.1 hypothetical protein KC343_g9264 [Hortaea werneckii]KAI7670078.1 hypothetical protein KC319_g5973 [Hortaea werneckii]